MTCTASRKWNAIDLAMHWHCNSTQAGCHNESRVVKDDKGEFELKALVPGWEYNLHLPDTPDGRIPWLGKLTVGAGEHKELGEFSIKNKP